MKPLHHLLACAVCVGALVATTPSPILAQAADEGNTVSDDVSKMLRGPEDNYDRIELYPGPEVSENENVQLLSVGEEYENYPELNADVLREDNAIVGLDEVSADISTLGAGEPLDESPFDTEDLDMDTVEDETTADNDQVEPSYEQDTLDFNRHLRS
ncbi:unnamed protein product [Phytophthora lilii]|uniref:Unnamed protein product n=1 Tax=Phytophthora lilii TaxID=2077276 RepID=A0A9W6U0D5_9STRA|nr:unnamed protein product [Phytophthora lilii]